MSGALNSQPLIAVLGSTGVGKSKLAVELSRAIMGQLHSDWAGADVINADSMQVYSGLDIITNKVTQDEMRAVPHHLLGHKDVLEANYMVHDWIKDALPVINRAHTQNRVPFVVGGTAYWIQHLIFPDRLAATDPQVGSSVPALSSVLSAGLASLSAEQRDLYDNVSDIITDSVSEDRALELHNLLLCLDPVTGARWHWRDTRKVVRSLEVMKENGCLASELYAAQSEASLATRYRTLLFWLNASPEVLNPRLDARVEQMVKLGLLDEIQTMRELAETLPQPVDHSCGIFQSIGYKEFSEYLDDPMRPQPLFDASLAKMRVSTAKYAQRQVKWILNKLLPACAAARDRIDLVVLDAGTADWDAEVLPHAMRALKKFLNQEHVGATESSISMQHFLEGVTAARSPLQTLAALRKQTCKLCTTDAARPFMVDEALWGVHTSTRQHRRAIRSAENQRQWQAYQAQQAEKEAQVHGRHDSSSSRDGF